LCTLKLMEAPTLYLMVGYPGSGKTTVSKIIHTLTGATHLWADHERNKRFPNPTHNHAENLKLYEALNAETQELLHQGKSVIFDTNFNFYKDRKKLRIIAAKEKARTVVIWVKTPVELARERAVYHHEPGETRIWGNMPLNHFERIVRNLEPPTEAEQPVVLDGTHIDMPMVAFALEQYMTRQA
jgi:predicted kinase